MNAVNTFWVKLLARSYLCGKVTVTKWSPNEFSVLDAIERAMSKRTALHSEAFAHMLLAP